MRPEYLKNTLDSELERLTLKLPETDPATDGYHILLSAIFRIEETLKYGCVCGQPICEPIQPAPETTTPTAEPVESASTEPTPAPTEDQPVVDTDDIKGDTVYVNPEDLRAALAEAKKKGINISELISSLGAPNFSGLRDDQNKLRQLKAMMEKALEEL